MADKSIKKLADTIIKVVDERLNQKPKSYDTQAVVRRIDPETGEAFVHIPNGIDETPVRLTVDASVGDTVQVRVADGKAWLTGNRTAPPTDDTTARVAQGTAAKAEVKAEQAEETANAVSGIANSALSQAVAAKQIADDTDQHFWFTETGADTGAHITEVTQEEWNDPLDPNYQSGGNLLARSSGIAVREGMTELATMSQAGFDAKTYDSGGNEVTIAHLGYGIGYDDTSALVKNPYYTLGQRNSVYHVGNYSVVEGVNGFAMAYCSHAEGDGSAVSTVNAKGAHAEGYSCNTSGQGGHSEGYDTYSAGVGAHSEGYGCQAFGRGSHAGGYYTLADSDYQTVIGKYNSPDMNDTFALIIGNGKGSSIAERSNALTVDWSGNLIASNIGTSKSDIPSAKSCQTGKWYKVGTLTLEAGVWQLDCNAAFAAANTTGTRQILVTTTNFTDGTTTAPTSYGAITRDILQGINSVQYPQSHFPVSLSQETTFYMAAYQGSNTTMSVTGRMYALRIK